MMGIIQAFCTLAGLFFSLATIKKLLSIRRTGHFSSSVRYEAGLFRKSDVVFIISYRCFCAFTRNFPVAIDGHFVLPRPFAAVTKLVRLQGLRRGRFGWTW